MSEQAKLYQKEIVSGIKRATRIPKTCENNLFNLAAAGSVQSINLAIKMVGEDHPLTREVQETASLVYLYIDGTRTILDDSINRWSDALGISQDRRDEVLRNLVLFDTFRYSGLATAEKAAVALLSGGWDADGKVDVPFQVVDSPEQGIYRFNKVFAHNSFEPSGSLPPYQAVRRPDVPFLYMYAADMGDLEPYLPQTIDTISALYNGEDIGLNEEAKSKFPNFGFTDETREELSRCGCLVLHPSYNRSLLSQ